MNEHVKVKDNFARVEMPPTVARFHQAHLERMRRLFPAPIQPAIPQRVIAEVAKPATSPKPLWFSIAADITPPKYIMIDRIIAVCCRYFGVTRLDLISARRSQSIVYPRQMTMYLAKTVTMKSLPEIGRRIGGRDHTTILHGFRKIEALVKTDWLIAFDVAHLESLIGQPDA